MLFGRRETPGRWARLRTALWPRRSWGRSLKYYGKRIMRLSGTPHAIAAGVACGVFASFTPLIGLHFLLGFFLAFVLGGNLIAAAFGTAFGNPLTFPLIWTATYRVGNRFLGEADVAPSDVALETTSNWASASFDALAPIIGPMMIGSVPLGLPTAVVFYVLVYSSVGAFQRMRRERIVRNRQTLTTQERETSDV